MKPHKFLSYEQICDRIEKLQEDLSKNTIKEEKELKWLLKRKKRLDDKAYKIFL